MMIRLSIAVPMPTTATEVRCSELARLVPAKRGFTYWGSLDSLWYARQTQESIRKAHVERGHTALTNWARGKALPLMEASAVPMITVVKAITRLT